MRRCPFYFGKERVFLLVCVERYLREGSESWPGDGEKVWCCWMGERIKIGCIGAGWGIDYRGTYTTGKEEGRKPGRRWDSEKTPESVEDELKPLLLD